MTSTPGRTSRAGRGRRLAAGLAAFAILCGLILVLASGREPSAAREDPRPDWRAEIQRALTDVSDAESSLRGANYGTAKDHIGEVERRLRRLYRELEEFEGEFVSD